MDSTYPHWAQFVGAFIVLLSVTAIPSFLIARLILRQSARDEAMEFITRQVQESKDVCESVRRFIQTRYLLITATNYGLKYFIQARKLASSDR